jgi:hypothetical protein
MTGDLSTCARCGGYADGTRVRVTPTRILSFCAECARYLGEMWKGRNNGGG